MTIHVEFEPVGRRGECPEGQSLLECARLLGVDLVNLCGGSGSCGRCIVQVLAGTTTEPADREAQILSASELAQGYRLACRAVPLSSCKVRVPPESLTAPQRTQVEGEEIAVALDPPVQAYTLLLTQPTLDDLRADSDRLLDALEEQHGAAVSRVDVAALQSLPYEMRAGDGRVRAVLRDDELIAVQPVPGRILGLAVDLGTTKIAAYLLDLETGETLASEGLMNPQIAYGEDVIARMAYATETPEHGARLQGLVVETLNGAVERMTSKVGAEEEQVVEAVVVGNTAMHHLFLRLPVEQLARAPYVPGVGCALDVKARDLGLRLGTGAYVHLLPNIAGYVGADHVAMLLGCGLTELDGVVLALDIGTNTEVCLSYHGSLTSLSCASGPAFEGAHIKHGMRAAKGAIEHLRLVGDKLEFQTISGARAVGLCGSGILDTLAQLYGNGVVAANGRMGEHPRVRGDGGKREFLLLAGEQGDGGYPDITFTQKDVRELQLAKGAMRTGVNVLLGAHDLTPEQVDQVIIAGAFGTYIDVTSAMTIGMLPWMPVERFRQVGNAAGMGAKMALISRAKRAEAQELARRIGYIELAAVPDFTRTFADAMYLG